MLIVCDQVPVAESADVEASSAYRECYPAKLTMSLFIPSPYHYKSEMSICRQLKQIFSQMLRICVYRFIFGLESYGENILNLIKIGPKEAFSVRSTRA